MVDAATTKDPRAARAQRLRERARTMHERAQRAEGRSYHREMAEVRALQAKAKAVEQDRANTGLRVAERRANAIKAIHCGRRDLGLDEDTYRSLLRKIAGDTDSLREMTLGELADVLDHMRKSGAPGKPVARRPRDPGEGAVSTGAQLGKVEAQLADMQLPWAYADGIARKMHRVDSVRFLGSHQLADVIAALDKEQTKRRLLAVVDDWLTAQGRDRAWLAGQHQLKPGWERHIKTLQRLVETHRMEAAR